MKQFLPICIIAPSSRLAEKAQEVIDELDEGIEIRLATLEMALDCVKEQMEKGTEIFISRTGTQALIERESKATVVGIRTGLSDYVEIMERAKDVKGLVAIFSYDDIPEDVKAMCRILGMNIRHYGFTGAEDARESVSAAIRDGALLGIGGAVTEGHFVHWLPILFLKDIRQPEKIR